MESLINKLILNLENISIFSLFFAFIFAFIKTYTFVSSMKIFIGLKLYFKKNNFRNHPLFTDLKFFKANYDYANNIKDKCRYELIVFSTSVDMSFSRIFFLSIFKYIYKENFYQFFIHYIFNVNAKKLTNYLILEHKDFRKNLPEILRDRMTKYMSVEDFNKFIEVYLEQTEVFFLFFQESLKNLSQKHNTYSVLWDVLDIYESIVKTYSLTIARKIMNANGRLNGIKFKGYTVNA